MERKLGIRWTMGDVSERGFEALRLSVWGAVALFGDGADYVICQNGIPLDQAKARTGPIPPSVRWFDASDAVPAFLREFMDSAMTEGSAWKLASVRLFPGRHELALDNDLILWSVPPALAQWLAEDDSQLIAQDVRRCFGAFDATCGDGARNAGIRGLAPGIDFASELEKVLREHGRILTSELDEQGLQVATLERVGPQHVVTIEDVSICSPFPPHSPHLGTCGAHFVGTNAKSLPWELDGSPATEHLESHWRHHVPEVVRRIRSIAPNATV